MTTNHPEHCEQLRCNKCHFVTVKKANYRQHLRTHLAPEDKPYRCDHEGCNYASANKEGLRIHLNSMHKCGYYYAPHYLIRC